MASRLQRYSPETRIRSDRQHLDEIILRANKALSYWIQLQSTRLFGLEQRLQVLNPHATLNRGYAVVSHLDGSIVRRVEQAHPGDELKIQVSDGEFSAEVIEQEK
jgi:exodeoxyribonuclease VII large subunit